MRIIVLFFSLLFFVSCAPIANDSIEKSKLKGFREVCFHTEKFTLFGMMRCGTEKMLHVYIEGDGHAWETASRPSADPTPRNPVALRLAMADTSAASVLYLARPCQYVQGGDRRGCSDRFWTSARLGEEAVASLDEAVSQAKVRAGAGQVALVGFSGGGGAAALVAARRGDVAFLATVAGLLDTDGWTARMHVSPLADSLNPLDAAPRLRRLAQMHYCGGADRTVPPETAMAFCRALGRQDCLAAVPGMEHGGAWETVMPDLLGRLGRAGRSGQAASLTFPGNVHP